MKWYETSLSAQWDSAFDLLKQGNAEAYAKAVKRVYILCMEREKQKRVDLEMTSALSHYQGIDALLHMEQSKLRVMTDEDLSISRMGLMCDCCRFIGKKTGSKQGLARARQALDKILHEMKRRGHVYDIDIDYWMR